MADTPYARTVAPKLMQPGALPDAGDIFDSIMTRKHTNPHPNKISSMLFYLASIIIHDLFRTDHDNFNNSKTSSYLDLSPLYGSNIDEQILMRTFKDGKIKPDCFSEIRLLSFPPGVGCILIMLNRFHNHVVENLQVINQSNKFKRPDGEWPDPTSKSYPPTWKKLDEDLFQTARLITCGLYINLILTDYVRTILNLNKSNSNWALDPRTDIKGVPVAAGNQVSAEFNLIYRWHSAISPRDADWTWKLWKTNFPDLDPATVDFHQFVMAASKIEDKLKDVSPNERPFNNWTRGKDGQFSDDELVAELSASIEDCSNSFGANRVPAVMRVIEILGIEQARAWNVASLNEFRVYFGLKPHDTFESINPNPNVAEQLRRLYDHPDYVELYPGLVAEDAKLPTTPGAGLTPSYTVSRAVLSDAVALVRGDRFYTIDYHPKKLTNWGFTEVAKDLSIDNGCVFWKLFLTCFPNHFKPDSVYAHYPLTIPSEMKLVLKTLERRDHYSYERPGLLPSIQVISGHLATKRILSAPDVFQRSLGDTLTLLVGEKQANPISTAISHEILEETLYPEDIKWKDQVRSYYAYITKLLLEQKAYKIAAKHQVDIIRDIGNLAGVHFASTVFGLPLKTDERPHGLFTEREIYLMSLGIFSSSFFDVDPVTSYPLQFKTRSAVGILGDAVAENIDSLLTKNVFSRLISTVLGTDDEGDKILDGYAHGEFYKRLAHEASEHKVSTKDLVYSEILPTMAAVVAHQGKIFAEVLEFFLPGGAGEAHWKDIVTLAADESDAAFDTLTRYVLEAARINGELGAFRTAAKPVDFVDDGKDISLKAGDSVLLNFRAAGRDATVFPDPETVKLDRPLDSYLILGDSDHSSLMLTEGISRVAITAMIKVVVGSLKHLRGAAGGTGKLHKLKAPIPGNIQLDQSKISEDEWFHLYLTENHDRLWAFPQSKLITFKQWY
jgi:linoleate 8R-lipoxygenase / 9,12-octadecadienoate 8-hydroperoxide 8R-isomerase